MLLLEDGPGGQRKESYYTTETVALPSASFKMMAGHSREGRGQPPDPESSEWNRKDRGPQCRIPRDHSGTPTSSYICCGGSWLGPFHRDE